MPYELTVAAKADPHDKPGRVPRRIPVLSTLALSGTLDEHASEAILVAVTKATIEGADSIVVEFGDVHADDTRVLEAFVADIMSLRERGTEVQIFAREDALHDRMFAMPNSRDWLLWRASDGSALPRKSLHVDGPSGERAT